MKKTTVFLFAVMLCVCFLISAERAAFAYEVTEKHPIDIEMERMIDEDPSTAGMYDAQAYGIEAWDKLLNENYQALMKKLTKEEQDKLRAAQREWIKYRDLEFAFNATFWGNFEGTMYRVFPGGYQYEFVKARALRLGYYLDDLDMREHGMEEFLP